MLDTLKALGVHLAVLSNKPHLQTKDVVATFFGTKTFTCVQGQQEGIPRKPDPAAVFMIAKELNVATEECLYIGDSDVDMQTGNAAGVTTIGVTWGFRSREILKENGAVYIVDKAEEIISIVKGEK
jgi:phosphoglycolate phosphatase